MLDFSFALRDNISLQLMKLSFSMVDMAEKEGINGFVIMLCD
jgi:hypothetical protein